ncbi:anti-sigma factor domain-containing protein [Gudongella sp. DL1XJH-153]|uniref:anti-sigma factor domain-containing protein n=1 Tax=Gudongella sp. DL1XJH-153 TaxID=3409804 RepID=UPI003BB4F1DB
MKAVILEIIKERAVVMKEDGTVRRVRNKNYSIGDEIYMKEGIFSHKRWAPIVAALLIFAMVGTGTWAYATPAYEISVMDGEKQEYLFEVNRMGNVIKVKYDENDYFEAIDPEIYKGRNIEEAIVLILEDEKFVYDDFEEILITANADNKEESEQTAEKLQERIKEYWSELEEGKEEVNEVNKTPRVHGLSKEDLVILNDYDITPGKLNIVKNLMYIEDKEEDDQYVENYLNKLEDNLEDGEKLSQKIMEEFSARNGEKNNPSVNAPGQVDKDDKEKKEKDTPPGLENKLEEGTSLRESREVDSDDDNDFEDENEDDTDESRRPESPGNSGSAPGRN